MKRTKVYFRNIAWCGVVALTAITARAQTLPITDGLQLWLKADAGVTANESGQVTAWADNSGLGNHATQSTLASAPTLAPASLNGLPTLRFVSPQVLEVPNANGIDTLTNDVTMLMVAKYDDITGYRGVISKCESGAPAPFDFYNRQATSAGRTRFYLSNTNGNLFFDARLAPPVGIHNVLGFRWKDGVIQQFLNDFNIGSVTNPAMVPTNGPSSLRIGRRADGVIQLVGNVAEVLIYKPALTEAEIYNVVTNYLQPKYGLAFNASPTDAITAPGNGTSVASGSIVPVSLSVADPDGYVNRLEVYGNDLLLATATATTTNTAFQLAVSPVGQGPVKLTAVASDNYGHIVMSAPVQVNVTATYPTAPLAAGLKVWLASDSGITTNPNGAVISWADQSGNGNVAVQQVDEGAAPLLLADAINGKPALRFDGVGSYLEVADEGTAFLTNDFTTFAVARFLGSYPALRQHVWSKCGPSGFAGPVDWWLNTGTGAPYGYRGDGTFFAGTGSGPVGPTLGRFSMLGMTVTGIDGVMAHFLGFQDNGRSVALTNTANAGPLRIGRRFDGGTQLNGDIAEILIYDQALSASDRSNVVAYLAGKYNLVEVAYASPPPVVDIVSPVGGASMPAPATVTFAVNASAANSGISRVTLSANDNVFATLTAPPFQVPLDLLTPGTVTFTAVAQDVWGGQTSTSIVVTVTGSASTPLVTDGLRLQLAADLGVTTNAAGAVIAWNDQSPSAYSAAPLDEATSPVLVPDALNGKPVLRFDGNNQFLEVAGDTSFTAGDMSTFAMVKFSNFSSFRTVWTKAANNLAAPLDWYYASGSGIVNVYRGDGFAYGGGAAGGAAPAGVFAVVGLKVTGTTINTYLGYNPSGSINITQIPFDVGPFRIGRRPDGAVQMNGDIAEILVYDRPVSDTERLQIANYLFNKWGLTVVQVANQPPTVSLTSPTTGTSVSAPGVVNVVAQAGDPDSAVDRVDFVANGSLVMSRTAPPYEVPLELLTPGSLTLTAEAYDIWGAGATSAPVVLTVTGTGPTAPPAAGLVLWLKADAGLTTNVDGSVLTWADQSGSGNDALQDPVYLYPTPILTTDTNTGLPTLYFDGSLQYLLVSNAPSLALTNDMSLFYGASFDDFDAVRSICGKTTLSEPHPFDYYVNSARQAALYRGDTRGFSSVISTDPFPAGSFVVAGVTVLGSQSTHYLQTLPVGSGAFAYGAIDDGTDLLIGTRDDRTVFMKGNLSEILLYDRALQGSDLQLVNSYLAAKYGVASFQVYTYTDPPALTATQSDADTVQISWPTSYSGFVLETRAGVNTGAWTPVVTNPPNNQVTLGTTNATQFFRLRAQ